MMFYTQGMIVLGLVMGCLSFVLNYGHLLNSLLSIEFLSLMVYWWLSLSSLYLGMDFFMLFYLVVAACSGALGLALLISSVHSHGSDYLKGYNSLMC